jgi:putative transposase
MSLDLIRPVAFFPGPQFPACSTHDPSAQVLAIVKEGEAGRKVADLCRIHGITEQTYHRWKAKYGGMALSERQHRSSLQTSGSLVT